VDLVGIVLKHSVDFVSLQFVLHHGLYVEALQQASVSEKYFEFFPQLTYVGAYVAVVDFYYQFS
jgi:hypothetical protein